MSKIVKCFALTASGKIVVSAFTDSFSCVVHAYQFLVTFPSILFPLLFSFSQVFGGYGSDRIRIG